jgi:hypothetical protein
MSRPPILLSEHKLLGEKVNNAPDDSQADHALHEYANELREAGERNAANLVGNFGAVCEFHQALCHMSERANKALLALSGNEIGGSLDYAYYDVSAIGLELTFLTATPEGEFLGPYPESTRLSEAQVTWINNRLQPLAEAAGKLMKEAGHPLQYHPGANNYYLAFSPWEIVLVTECLETLASGYE